MHDDLRLARSPASHPAGRRPWSQPPHVDEPIMDAARAPVCAYFSPGGPSWSRLRKIVMSLWLHVLRPLLTIGMWVGGLLYAWPYVLDAPRQPDTQQLLWLYAFIIGGIFCFMLLIAPLRKRQHRETKEFRTDDSTLMALADFIEVAPAELSLYQKTQRLFVQHNPHGRLRSAMTSSPAAQPLPLEALS